MDLKINELLDYFDRLFFEDKVEIDNNGRMGLHYQALNFDHYLDYSVFSVDYLSIEDYFLTEAGVNYNEEETLCSQYSSMELEVKIKICASILTLINASTYGTENKENVLKQSVSFLTRFGLEVKEYNNKIYLEYEKKFNEGGSYCNIYIYDSLFLKKKLKKKFTNDEKWKKRFKYEYENMSKLGSSDFVLKVFCYNEDEHSYLMEKCDCDLEEYLKQNHFSDEELIIIIKNIIRALIDVHNEGIIHRDLHLGNLLVKDKKVIVSDFGLSKDTMINHSLKSTSTPKNSHYFLDPIGLSDFTKLDKLSDIFSIGKIIDYITRDSELNEKLSYIISKATERERSKRYHDLKLMLKDIEIVYDDISKEERINVIITNIINNNMSPGVEDYIQKLIINEKLSNFIVEKKLFDFWKTIINLKPVNQEKLLEEMNKNYVEATGYMQFENYDIFANIVYNYIVNISSLKLQKKAYKILKGCASMRYKAENYLDLIDRKYPLINE